MPLRHTPLARRTLLKGMGMSLGLPWLEAMSAPPPVRFAALYMPNGVREDTWTPPETGRNFTITPTLEPLAGLKDQLMVLTNLWNQASVGGDGHYVKMSGFLTSTTVTKTLGVDINCNGISMDQVAAQTTGQKTPIASLELGILPVTTGVDKNVGYTRVYGSHIAWSSPTTPLAREVNPHLVFERLFHAGSQNTDTATQDRQLLDGVLDDAKQLRGKLGQADRIRLDEYLSVVRGLEDRLARASRPQTTPWKPRVALNAADKPPAQPKDYADHVRLMLDMIALAFQSDSTRIVTFIFGNEVSNQNFSFVDGVKGGHHSISHHENQPENLRQYQLINRWHVAQYAYLLQKLQGMREGEGTVLDHSAILFGSGFRDGNKHDPHNLPLLLAGRGGGRLATGQHLSYGPDTPLSNLYVSLLDVLGAPVERFADSTGRLPGVLA
ncbi:MAG: DUF1552 domain-containing protein [Bryobacteraceae bacterium]|nr:DUF1552 domain-containing protein [Bryobacteraceae bacterium]